MDQALNLPPRHPHGPQRIASLDVAGMQSDWLATLERIPGAGLKGEGFPRNVLGVLMHNPDTLGPFLEYWVTSKQKMHLTVREQELVILRMGVLYGSDYVFKHHVQVGREFGIDDSELSAIRQADYSAFPGRERQLLQVTDALVEQRRLSESLWQAAREELSESEVVDLVGLVSQYVLFALMNNVAQVAIEPPLHDVPGIAG